MINIFFWITFGALVGWVAAILQDEHRLRRVGAYLAAGALGGLAGGLSSGLIDASAAAQRASAADIVFAIFGATFFVFLAGYAAQRRTSTGR